MNEVIEGYLEQGKSFRWRISGHELSPGARLKVNLNNKWVEGFIRFVESRLEYLFITKSNHIPMHLHCGLKAKLIKH